MITLTQIIQEINTEEEKKLKETTTQTIKERITQIRNTLKTRNPHFEQYLRLHDEIDQTYLQSILEKTIHPHINPYEIKNTTIQLITEETLLTIKPWNYKKIPTPDYIILIDTPKKAILHAIEIKGLELSNPVETKALQQCFTGLRNLKNDLNKAFTTKKQYSDEHHATIIYNQKSKKINPNPQTITYQHTIRMQTYQLTKFKRERASFKNQKDEYIGELHNWINPDKGPRKYNLTRRNKKHTKITIT